MSSDTIAPPPAETKREGPPAPASGPRGADAARIGIGLVGMAVTLWLLGNTFLAFAYHPEWFADSKILIGLVALVVGVGGAALLFFFLNMFVEGLPEKASERVMPYAYVLPGFGLLSLMLLYPTIQTINYSFANADSTKYIGFDNYREIFKSQEFRDSILNNLLWLIVVPAVVVAIGTVVAVLSDKLSTRGEQVSKSLMFLPMAISIVGASAIWTLVYAYDSPGETQTGLLNWIYTGLGGDPVTWLQTSGGRLNSFLMMVILIWLQVGFAMILLSSAIKGVPEDTLEAARIDGANELQIFWRVVIPQIRGTIITVFITVLITVLKVFDIVYVLTNGNFKTNVIANLFFNKLFADDQAGQASAIVVILLIAVLPVLYWQVKHFREEEGR